MFVFGCPGKTEEGTGFLDLEVVVSCLARVMRTKWVLWMNSRHARPPRFLGRLLPVFFIPKDLQRVTSPEVTR